LSTLRIFLIDFSPSLPYTNHMMNAWQLSDSPSGLTLLRRQLPRPVPAADQILIQVHAAGVTPSELQWYPTTHDKAGNRRVGAVPSHEFSGVVAEVGSKVTEWTVGEAVFGMSDWFSNGATAEFCVTTSAQIAIKPARIDHTSAASVPISALTAWQGLLDRAKLTHGERVLIHGGSGGVGVMAIQLAKLHGAHVITTASQHHHETLKQLGADELIDYHRQAFEEVVGKVDVIFDGVGGETLAKSWALLRPNGRLVTIAADSEATTDPRIKEAFFIVEPRGAQLTEIARLIDAGQLRPVVNGVLSFDRAGEAYMPIASNSRGAGKTVVKIAD
jgi:NADPH:quinone reductase-like Zn-dependent oxidoreductase